jgi:hypothetical protein
MERPFDSEVDQSYKNEINNLISKIEEDNEK